MFIYIEFAIQTAMCMCTCMFICCTLWLLGINTPAVCSRGGGERSLEGEEGERVLEGEKGERVLEGEEGES